MADSWIEFEETENPGRKTRKWWVKAKSNSKCLGYVVWFNAWRCYAFFPEISTVWNVDCLNIVAAFCEKQTKDRKEERRKEREREQEAASTVEDGLTTTDQPWSCDG